MKVKSVDNIMLYNLNVEYIDHALADKLRFCQRWVPTRMGEANGDISGVSSGASNFEGFEGKAKVTQQDGAGYDDYFSDAIVYQ